MQQLHVFLLLLTLSSQQEQRPLARTELFPEQLEQQQLQFKQSRIQQELQALQRRWQVAQGVDLQVSLQQQQSDLLAELQDIQRQQQVLQTRLQEKLNGEQPSQQEQRPPQRIVNPTPQTPQFQQQRPVPPDFQQQRPVPPDFQQQRPVPPDFQEQRPVPPDFQEQRPVPPNFQQQRPVPPDFQEQRPVPPDFQQQRPVPPDFQEQRPVPPDFQQQRPVPPESQQERPESPQQKRRTPPPCATQAGEAGSCLPLIKCVTFYTEVPELRRQTCQIAPNEFGVCCPLRRRPPVAVSNDIHQSHGVLHRPPPPHVIIPPFSPQQLDHAANIALERLRERLELLELLFANHIVIVPGTPAAWHHEFFQTTNETLQLGDQAQKNVEASVSLVNEFNLTAEQGTFALPTFSILNTVIADTCPSQESCNRLAKYRTADGSCNNLGNQRWASTGSALQRILPPKYGDGVNAPRSTSHDGEELPSARFVSTRFAGESDRPYDNYTLLVMQWGQFLDHDLTHTPITRGQSGSSLSCCRDGKLLQADLRHPDCFPISIPRTDKIFSPFGDRCMEFVRSLPAQRPDCNFGPREQMNQVTGYLDGSNIYGSSQKHQKELREFRGGRLRSQNFKGRQMLPRNPGECMDQSQRLTCFSAGDSRVNEQVQLVVMHTVWMREHNRVADILSDLNPRWNDETIFQEARRIIVAEMQHITYNEFLPLILGRDYMEKFELTPRETGQTRIYDDALNAGVTNVFATAAFRFGHTLIQGTMKGFSQFGTTKENLVLSEHQFQPFVLYDDGAFDNLIRGVSTQTCQRFDRFFSKELTDKLFQGDQDTGLDLVALNIQRARDHGIPPYNDWREVCGQTKATSWEGLLDVMDPQSVEVLKSVYGSVDEVDLFVGLVAERPVRGALLGPTLVCLIGDQFARLRRGDRFFYEEGALPGSFSEDQLEQLRKVNLARVLCDNSDDIALMQPLAFFQASFANQRVACSSESIPVVDLRAWKGEKVNQ